MGVVRRGLVILAGIACGVAVALVALPLLLVFDSLKSETNWLSIFMDLAETAYDDLDSEDATSGLAGFVWIAAFAICVLPVTAMALIGELGRLRTARWYIIGSGLIAALMPWLARAILNLEEVGQVTPLEARLALLFFVSGAAGGLVYWFVAGLREPRQIRSGV
jgi:hypothetical protein